MNSIQRHVAFRWIDLPGDHTASVGTLRRERGQDRRAPLRWRYLLLGPHPKGFGIRPTVGWGDIVDGCCQPDPDSPPLHWAQREAIERKFARMPVAS